MSSSYTTTPSDPGAARLSAPPSRRRTFATYFLLCVWLALISFGVIGYLDPPWLRALTQHGREIELTEVTNFGDDAFRRGDLRQAIGQYSHALAIDPNNIRVRTNLGIAMVQAGMSAEGSKYLNETLTMTDSPISRGLIYYTLGTVHEARNEREQAIDCYEKAAATGTQLGKAYYKLGTLHLAAKELPDAYQAFEFLLADRLDVRRGYRDMLGLTAETLAEDSVQVAVAREQLAHPFSDEEMAKYYDLETIRRVINGDRDVAVAHNYLGWVLVQMEKFDEAATHFEQSLAIWPGNRNASENLAVIRQMRADRLRAGAAGSAS